MIPKKIIDFLQEREFISVATSDLSGLPNAAPKMLLRVEGSCLYLIDYTIGTTYRNLRVNPRLSLSFMDLKTLVGYQINGRVEIIEKGKVYESMLQELRRKEIELSITRVVEGIKAEKSHEAFEVAITEHLVIFRVAMDELVEIGPHGGLKREEI